MDQVKAPVANDPAQIKIRHQQTNLGQPVAQPRAAAPAQSPAQVPRGETGPPNRDDLSSVKVAGGDTQTKKEIRTFGGLKRHEDEWTRTPNVTGQGAIHVKTFHGKLTEDALVYMDRLINEWLDAHPEYEVKFVSSSIGEFSGKFKEPNLICQIWV